MQYCIQENEFFFLLKRIQILFHKNSFILPYESLNKILVLIGSWLLEIVKNIKAFKPKSLNAFIKTVDSYLITI